MHHRGNTSLLLIMLILIVGVGIGWIIRDLVLPPGSPPQVSELPSSRIATPAALGVSPSLQPATVTLTATDLPYPTVTATEPSLPTLTAIPTPTRTALPTSTPLPPDPIQLPIIGYAVHTVADGETLAQIAELGGSDPQLIAAYNHMAGEPATGRALVIPQVTGRTSQLPNPPTLIERGPGTQPWVALTLDAGAGSEPAGRMLDVLRERGIRITFFLTGTWIRENPELTRQIVADGHEVANHTQNHPDLRQLDDDAIRKELADTEAALREVTGASTRPFFRPPFGAYDKRVLAVVQSEGYLPIYWTLDSLDSVGDPKSVEFLLERVTTKLPAEQLRGAIILAHCGNPSTAEALPAILDRFRELGFEVHTLSEVLGVGG